jgi:hypothetical protein
MNLKDVLFELDKREFKVKRIGVYSESAFLEIDAEKGGEYFLNLNVEMMTDEVTLTIWDGKNKPTYEVDTSMDNIITKLQIFLELRNK